MITPDNDTLKLGFHTLDEVYHMPDFVKQADMEDFSEDTLNSLPTAVFADTAHRCYPCHTKAATWISLGYFLKDYDNIPDDMKERLLDRFEKKASYFGMMPEYTSLIQQTVMLEKQADAKKAAYTLTSEGGVIENEEDVFNAANWLVAQRNKLPLQKRAELATKIIKKADQFHVKLPQRATLEQTAGMGVNDPADIISSIRTRSTLVKNSEYSHQLSQLADRLSRFITSPFDKIWVKVAYAIDDFDKLAGLLPSRETGKVPMPEEVVFTYPVSTIKEANDATVQLTNGDVYQLSKLAEVNRAQYEDIFGSEMAENLFVPDSNLFDKEAAADVLATLPVLDAIAFSDRLRKNGITPLTKMKTAGYSITRGLFSTFD